MTREETRGLRWAWWIFGSGAIVCLLWWLIGSAYMWGSGRWLPPQVNGNINNALSTWLIAGVACVVGDIVVRHLQRTRDTMATAHHAEHKAADDKRDEQHRDTRTMIHEVQASVAELRQATEQRHNALMSALTIGRELGTVAAPTNGRAHMNLVP